VEALRIVQEAADGGCLWMTLSGGDPFIRSDFREIYDFVVSLGIIPTIFASGLIMTDEWLEHLQKTPPLKIEVPLYGITAETYEQVAGKKGTFATAVNNIRRMVDAGLPLKLKSKILTLNLHEVDLLKDFVESELGLPFVANYFLYPRLDHSRDHLQYRLTPAQILALEKSYDISGCDSSSSNNHADEQNPDLFRCAAGINSFYVNPYGELNFCTYVRQSSYDLKTGSIVDGVKALRADLLSRTRDESSACGKCSIQGSCQNCPGHAVLETGSLDGKSEYLCEVNHAVRGKEYGS
jgi:radical SAM protein with 4Fe4S-binding SPASM domain